MLFNCQNLPIGFFASFHNTIGEPYTKKTNKNKQAKNEQTNAKTKQKENN